MGTKRGAKGGFQDVEAQAAHGARAGKYVVRRPEPGFEGRRGYAGWRRQGKRQGDVWVSGAVGARNRCLTQAGGLALAAVVGSRPGLLPPEVVGQTLDIVLAEISPGLDLDEDQFFGADALDAVRRAGGDVDRLPR